MKGPITIDYLEKVAPVNSASYFECFRQNLPYLLNSLCTLFFIWLVSCLNLLKLFLFFVSVLTDR